MSGGWADGIVANTLFVRDLAAAKEFYGRAFETEPIFEDPNSVVFKLGPVIVNLLHESAVPELVKPAVHAGPEAGVRLVFTVGVDDVDARVEALKAAGVELLNGPVDRPWGPRTASFRDLDGYVWEIAGEPKAKD